MIEKQKAIKLVRKYARIIDGAIGIVMKKETETKAKQCALASVDEILENDSMGMSTDGRHLICDTDYWYKVKDEIASL